MQLSLFDPIQHRLDFDPDPPKDQFEEDDDGA